MQAVKKVSPLLIHKHISFSAGDLSGEVLTDEKWLVFVLEQLLTNASKYTKEGGSVRIGKENGLLVLRDTGIGIRPEDLPWRQSEKRLDAGHWQRLFLRRCKKWKKKCKQKPWQSISSFFILYLQ